MITILLVEDDDLNRDMLTQHFKRKNYAVISAVNGEEGMRMAEENLPDVVLMDMNMPEMDGLEATRLIKKNPATAHIPVIILSGHDMPSYVSKEIAGCGDAYDTKPVDFERLFGKIQEILQK